MSGFRVIAVAAPLLVGACDEPTPDHLVFLSIPTGSIAATDTLPEIQVAFAAADGDVVSSVSGALVRLGIAADDPEVELLGETRDYSVSGISRFDGLRVHRAGTYRLWATAVVNGVLDSIISEPFDIVAGDAVALLIDSVRHAPAGQPLFVRAIYADLYGNRAIAPDRIVSLALPPSSAMTGTFSAATTHGSAVFNDLVGTRSGTYSVVAAAPGLAPDTAPIIVFPGPATQIVWTHQPSQAKSGAWMPVFALQIRDAWGNPVSGSTGMGWGMCTAALDHNPTGATLVYGSPPNLFNSGANVVSNNVAIDRPGEGYTLVIRCTQREAITPIVVTSVPSVPFNVLP